MKETKELKKESELEKIKDDKLDSLKDKLSKIKTKIDKFQNGLLKKFDKYVVGIALLPPLKDQKDALDLLVLVDDGDSKKMPKLELRDKLNAIANNMAKEIDKNFRIDVMLLSEMTQNCYDNKTEFMKEIAMSASIYDPKDLIAAVKVSDVHKEMVLKKFEKYIISYVAAGSLFRGEKSNDIDVYVIVDDTDVKKMSRFELKEKLRAIILSQAFEANSITRVKKKFHVQVYILTDFWEGIKDANPVFFTLLRDGIPLYDRGVFMPWKLLLEMGRIKPSPEAIDTFVASGDKMMERVRFKLREIIEADIYWSTLTPSQAALMMYGVAPPTPKETINIMEEIFVKKEKLLEKRYIDILTEIRRYYKDLEHDKIKTLTGKDIDKLLKNANDYLKRIKKLFAQIEERKNEENMNEIYDTVTNLVKDVLKENEIDNKNLELGLRKLKDKNEISPKMLATFKDVEKAKKEREKISKPEFNKIRKDSRLLINQLMDHLQRKRFRELDKVTLRIKSNDKYSEIIILEDNAFIIDDIKRRDIVGLAKINKDGSLGEVNKSSAKELEENLDKKKIEKNVFVKEALFKSLKELFGKDMEILIGY
ncbi:hypothetical protein J4442_03055 [Candidatus Woesearchaeota archaeon]|nr:hypothetical protein [Candidatus Woesearchaeota archaeon]